MRDRKLPVVAIAGSTCTGKTSLSIALAKELESEIVACDSRTVYRYMDIGTAKPTEAERDQVVHHMLDVVDPDHSYSTAEYKRAATPIVEKLIENNRIPIVCGGTGFYFRNLLEGLEIPPVPPQPELRNELKAIADEQGNSALHEKLRQLDPTSADRISVNDRFRLVRAIEVCICMGRPFSEVAKVSAPAFPVVWIGLHCADRDRHMHMIRERLQAQFQAGFLREAEQLYKKYGACASLTNTVGYAELLDHLEGKIELAQAQELCATHTLQLARKQMIWFRKNKKINWFAIDDVPMEMILREIRTLIVQA